MASHFFPTTTRMLESPSSSRTSVPNQTLTSSSPRVSLSTNFLSPFVGGSVTGDFSGQKMRPAYLNPYTSSLSGSHAKRGVLTVALVDDQNQLFPEWICACASCHLYSGACGFGDYGRTVNDGSVSGVSRLYRNGAGCGACYQVRCKIPQLCTEDGVKVVVTDYGEGDKTDFILSTRAYGRLARPNSASSLFAYGVVDIEYKRISCQYPGNNLMVKVQEQSRFPDYLAVVIVYQAGQNDINAVEVWEADYQQWRGMRKAYGAVWDTSNPPADALDLRVLVSGSAGLKWVQLSNVIPSQWKAGAVYETTTQLN